MSRLLDNLLFFGRLLRRSGIDVHPGRMIDLVDALGHVNLSTRDEVYHTCRALLVHRREQLAVFDVVFDHFWRQRLGRRSAATSLTTPPSSTVDKLEPPPSHEIVAHVGPVAGSDKEAASLENGVKTWSERTGLATKDFAALTPGEIPKRVWRLRVWSGTPASAARAGGSAAADRKSICAAPSATVCARAATSSCSNAGCEPFARGRSCCFAT